MISSVVELASMRKRWLGGAGAVVASLAAAVAAGALFAQEPPGGGNQAKPAAAPTAPEAVEPGPKGDEAGVIALFEAINEAYNRADPMAIGKLFAADAIMIDEEGNQLTGREAIEASYALAFEQGDVVPISGEIELIRFLTPDVASLTGSFELRDGEIVVRAGRFNMIASRTDGAWKVAELHDYAVKDVYEIDTGSNYNQLSVLEWMVGEWEEKGEGTRVVAEVFWDEGRNYLIRDYVLELDGEPVTKGRQYIGWDAQALMIRSWSFDTDGGFGEATWTPTETGWMLKARGRLREGLETSATQYLEILNPDSFKFVSTDRVVGGEAIEGVSETVLARRPPEPALETGEDEPAKEPAAAPAAEASEADKPDSDGSR